MRTVLFTPCYLDGSDEQGNDRLERVIRYVRYYQSIQAELGFEKVMLLDNGSSPERVESFRAACPEADILSLPHLEHHKRSENHYPHCWRGLYHVHALIAQGYEKIIMIDTDGYVVSKRLADYLRGLSSGWVTFWCPRWRFPDSAISVLSKDAFSVFTAYASGPYTEHLGKRMENVVPYTHVERGFNCDRFGEWKAPLTEDMDYYGQAGPEIEPKLSYSQGG